MAFVYKAEKAPPLQENLQNLGPGKYIAHQIYKFKENNVGFLSTSEKMPGPKIEQKKNSNSIDLALTTNFSRTQSLFSGSENINKEKKRIKKNKEENSVFKSGSKRFEPIQKLEDFPGPGAYKCIQSHPPPKNPIPKKENTEKKNIIDEIMLKENYQPIPSIPTNSNALGYAETEDGSIRLNQTSAENRLFPGPGTYEMKSSFEMKGKKVYFKSKN